MLIAYAMLVEPNQGEQMAMSKKDYTKFAALFAGEISMARQMGLSSVTTVKNIILSTADIFAQDNPRFDRERFYAASGL